MAGLFLATGTKRLSNSPSPQAGGWQQMVNMCWKPPNNMDAQDGSKVVSSVSPQRNGRTKYRHWHGRLHGSPFSARHGEMAPLLQV